LYETLSFTASLQIFSTRARRADVRRRVADREDGAGVRHARDDGDRVDDQVRALRRLGFSGGNRGRPASSPG
jgi:hypothetical protein